MPPSKAVLMGPAVYSVSANSGDSVGVRQSTALLGGPQPEAMVVFLALVMRVEVLIRGGRGPFVSDNSTTVLY